MMKWLKRSRANLITILISLVITILLVRAVGWNDVLEIFHRNFSGIILGQFSILALAIAFIYGYRWRLLLDRKLTHKASLISSIISLGGNMFLPARGGDILRLQYSRLVADMPYASLVSRLLVEKFIDLTTIATIGVLATVLLHEQRTSVGYSILVILTASALVAVFVAAIIVKFFGEVSLRWLHFIFRRAGKLAFYERHIVHLVRDVSSNLTVGTMMLPFLVTLFMWLSVYSLSYIVAAKFVGITLTYSESLFVLFAGTLGLMIPAAPSGVGTFHASVVSAFVILGRSPVEGLLVATAIHLLFLAIFALPAALFYGSWRINHNISQ